MSTPDWTLDLDRDSRVPLYRQIHEALRHAILTGAIPPGSALPSQQEYSDELGVNHITFRKAMSMLDAEGLIRRKRRVGTFVTEPKQWSPEKPLQRIGIVLWGSPSRFVQGYYASALVECIQVEARAQGLEVALLEVNPDEDSLTRTVEERGVSGVVCEAAVKHAARDQLARLQLPVVALEYAVAHPNVDTIRIDSTPGAYAATQALLKAGHREIGYVVGLLQDPDRPFPNRWKMPQDAPQRLAGYRQALEDAGLTYRKDRVYEIPIDVEPAQRLIARLKHNDKLPGALCAFDDKVAQYLLEACQAENLEVPTDLSVTGFGNFTAKARDEELATVVVDWPGMARMAVQRLYERMNLGGMAGLHLTVGTSFKDGRSIGSPSLAATGTH